MTFILFVCYILYFPSILLYCISGLLHPPYAFFVYYLSPYRIFRLLHSLISHYFPYHHHSSLPSDSSHNNTNSSQLLQSRLRVLNLDSPTDYRKIPRPSKNVYFSPLNKASEDHANEWFEYFGGQPLGNARPSEIELWGRKYSPSLPRFLSPFYTPSSFIRLFFPPPNNSFPSSLSIRNRRLFPIP